MKVTKRSLIMGAMLTLVLLFTTGCSLMDSLSKDFNENLKGLNMTVRTYDENSQIIDEMNGKSLSITRNSEFDSTNSDGFSNHDSKVLNITLGGNEITHVGSSLVAAENGLHDYFDDYAKTVDISNQDRSTPVVNRIVNKFKNDWTGKARIVLIRSQNGTPLATYVGDEVSLFSTEVPSSTNLLIDGKRLFIYRCDYTVYDLSLFNN